MTLPNDFNYLPCADKLKLTLNDPQNCKITAQYVTNILNIRNRLLNEL